jgi:hypothetical protein
MKKYTEGGNSPWMKQKMSEAAKAEEDAKYWGNALEKSKDPNYAPSNPRAYRNRMGSALEEKNSIEDEMLRGEKK